MVYNRSEGGEDPYHLHSKQRFLYFQDPIMFIAPSSWGAEHCDQYVGRFVCLSVCVSVCQHGTNISITT